MRPLLRHIPSRPPSSPSTLPHPIYFPIMDNLEAAIAASGDFWSFHVRDDMILKEQIPTSALRGDEKFSGPRLAYSKAAEFSTPLTSSPSPTSSNEKSDALRNGGRKPGAPQSPGAGYVTPEKGGAHDSVQDPRDPQDWGFLHCQWMRWLRFWK